MRRFNGLDIEVTQGDTLAFRVNLTGRELPPDTVGLFTIKQRPKDEEVVVEKRVPIENGAVNIHLSSADTDIQAKTYYWDLRIMMPIGDGTYTVVTPMEYAAFTTLEAIGNV